MITEPFFVTNAFRDIHENARQRGKNEKPACEGDKMKC